MYIAWGFRFRVHQRPSQKLHLKNFTQTDKQRQSINKMYQNKGGNSLDQTVSDHNQPAMASSPPGRSHRQYSFQTHANKNEGNQSKPTFVTLLPEIHLQIFDFLDCRVASQCLGLTCKKFLPIHQAVHGDKLPLDLLADFTPNTTDPEWYWLHTLLKDWVGEGMTYSRAANKFW